MNVRMDEQIMSVDQRRLQMKVEQIIDKCKNKTANETSKQTLTWFTTDGAKVNDLTEFSGDARQ